jgi:hypothetical protein
VDDASSDGAIADGLEDEHVATRAHFFSRTLGDSWLEIEPGIYLQRSEVSALEHGVGAEETLGAALSGALPAGGEGAGDEQDEASGRLRRWLHR